MQAIILAAGRGTRMGSLTDNCPKPMLTVLGKNLLEYKLEALPEIVDEIIFVVGYKKEGIQNYFGNNFTTQNAKTFNIKYVEQMELDGTMGALNLCKDLLQDRFIVLMGDDIYSPLSLQKICEHPLSILGKKDDSVSGGKIYKSDMGLFVGLKEGLTVSGSGEEFVNCGAYVLDKRIFEIEPVLVKEGEYGLPHTMLAAYEADKNFQVFVVETDNWINITSPESIQIAEKILA